MARNMVQFQKGLSMVEFLKNYGTEEACRKAVFQLRWPNGSAARSAAIRPAANSNRARSFSATVVIIRPR